MNNSFTRRRSAPSPVHEILTAALRRRGLDKKIEQYRFVSHWGEIVGNAIAEKTKPKCIQNRALVIEVTSSVWAQELSFHKNDILKRLSPYLTDDQIVEDVRFTVTAH